MDLLSGKLYWPETLDAAHTYPMLEQDIDCDVLIIGAGSSGAQCAYYLSNYDLKVVVADKRKAGTGSTSVNTALIQYAGDKTFAELINSFGEAYSARHLKLCEKAIKEIENAEQLFCDKFEFEWKDTLYYASSSEDIAKLEQEYHYLRKHGFPVELWDEKKIEEHYSFIKPAAIYYKNDAVINPLKFTYALLDYAKSKGAVIYENTALTGHKIEGNTTVFFSAKGSIRAKKVIFACGYEGLEIKKEKNAVITSSYAVVTNQIADFTAWYNKTLIWESARPYIYFRTTADNRIIIGGLDENTGYADARDAHITHKREQLINELHKLFPDIDAEPEYFLAAFYGGTHDGLPIIGEYKEIPNSYFLFAYGDNGTVYSMVLSQIITDIIVKGQSSDLELYRQDRPLLMK
ncbi:NAD(P)/FAD-dependent oxidoreductase [Cytobacillus firmus]|uniref:FAD-binding oxidoreductase n=1 Tax=Cytobacillus firmus TaxID=1399 RepID=A0AA46Q425_CYTFI|nr:FAD-dependent oxidoreductase [Cytobacillus firmus]KML46385.1 FAD-dependent oxidoreductase [Cytobacillus firmus]MCU1804004.1 FAD-binding oxidoreductase [Cytobacillus firmus]UYG95939.1 FAD-binding oxidoreductase [Cytobacillus firmus]